LMIVIVPPAVGGLAGRTKLVLPLAIEDVKTVSPRKAVADGAVVPLITTVADGVIWFWV
jgi:hypothetical protein